MTTSANNDHTEQKLLLLKILLAKIRRFRSFVVKEKLWPSLQMTKNYPVCKHL